MTTSLASPRAAFQYRDFRLYQGARFLSTIATQMQSVAVGWQVYELTRSPFDLGLVGFVQFLPAIGFSLLTGHAADRFDRRRVVAVCYAGLVVSSLLLFAHARSISGAAWPIYATLFLFATTRAFAAPAGQALVPHLVRPEHFASAVAWGSSVWEIAAILGPALGGWLYAFGGAQAAYLFAACSYFAATLLVASMRVVTGRMEKGAATVATLFAGVRYVWQKKIILGSITLDLFAVLLGGAVALLPVYARDILHVGPRGLGMLRSAPAVGAAVVAVLIAYKPLSRRAGVTMLGCVFLFGVATVVFGLSHDFTLSLVALATVGAADMVSVVVRQTLVQLATPPSMRGRVSAVNMVFIGASNELGEMESGLTAAWWGTVPAVVIGGLLSCVVVAAAALVFPELRRVDKLDAQGVGSAPDPTNPS